MQGFAEGGFEDVEDLASDHAIPARKKVCLSINDDLPILPYLKQKSNTVKAARGELRSQVRDARTVPTPIAGSKRKESEGANSQAL